MARVVNFEADSEIIEIFDWRQEGGIFVHRNLLHERSSYFRTLIENSKTSHQGHLVIKLYDHDRDACEMLARWLYGQPFRANNNDPEADLAALAEIYGSACDEGAENDSRNIELVDASVDAIRQCLVQKTKTLRDPIGDLESLLVKGDRYPGKAVILRELVYGECATDGRTKTWLEEYCAYGHQDAEEIAKLICIEFAKKACEQSQKNSGSN